MNGKRFALDLFDVNKILYQYENICTFKQPVKL